MSNRNITLNSLRRRKKYREPLTRYRLDNYAFVTVDEGIKVTETNPDIGDSSNIRGYPDQGLHLSVDETYSDGMNLMPGGRLDVLPYFKNTNNYKETDTLSDLYGIYIKYVAQVTHGLESIAFYITSDVVDPNFSTGMSFDVSVAGPYPSDYHFQSHHIFTLTSGWNYFHLINTDTSPSPCDPLYGYCPPLRVEAGSPVNIILSCSNNDFKLAWNVDQPGLGNVLDPRLQAFYIKNNIHYPFIDSETKKIGCPLIMINPTPDFKPQIVYGPYKNNKIPLYVNNSWTNYTIPSSGIYCTISGSPEWVDNAFINNVLSKGWIAGGIFIKPNPLELVVRPQIGFSMDMSILGITKTMVVSGVQVNLDDYSERLVGTIDPLWIGDDVEPAFVGNCRSISNAYNKVMTPVDSGDIFDNGSTQNLLQHLDAEYTTEWNEISGTKIRFHNVNLVDLVGSATISGCGEISFKLLGDSDEPVASYLDPIGLSMYNCIPGYATNSNAVTYIKSLEAQLITLRNFAQGASEIGLVGKTTISGSKVILKEDYHKGVRIKGWVEI